MFNKLSTRILCIFVEKHEIPLARRSKQKAASEEAAINNTFNCLRGMHEGAAAPSYEIRSGDMRGARSGCKPLP